MTMKLYRYISSIMWTLAVIALSACSNDDHQPVGDGENVSVTFHPSLGGDAGTRTIGDATNISLLKVAVYEGTETLSKLFTHAEDWTIAQRDGVTLSLIKNSSYKILFWAEKEGNTAYTLTDDGKITANYTDYTNGGFAKMEEMDAFYATTAITVTPRNNEVQQIELSRPFAQLNFVDNTTIPEEGHRTVVTFHNIPASFNPFTGEVSMTNDADISFTFTDFPDETLHAEGTDCHYVASNYLFAPSQNTTKVSATIKLYKSGHTFHKTFEFKDEKAITLERNKKTNIIGGLLPENETEKVSSIKVIE